MARIEGYCSSTSVIAGETAVFHLSWQTDDDDRKHERVPFNWELYRMGVNDVRVAQGTGVTGHHPTPANAGSHGCGWPAALAVHIPAESRSGVYLLEVISGGDQTQIQFVVRAARPGSTSPRLVMIPVTTAAAYNKRGGQSLYAFQGPQTTQVSLDRPGHLMVGTGDRTGREAGGNLWEETFIRWLEAGYTAEYCTSIDLHEDPLLLSRYQLLLCVGHDEYWSAEMRDNAEGFVAAGGNIAIFSGNTCYWQVRFQDGNRTMVCHKELGGDPLAGTPLETNRWDQVGRPENSLTGVCTQLGAVGAMVDYEPIDYTVHYADHWVFENTDLKKDGRFGRFTDEDNRHTSIVGYECDAAEFVTGDDGPVVTGRFGTPGNFVVLASADLSTFEQQPGKATMGLYYNRGVVFNAACTNWVKGLRHIREVEQITKNVLNRLSLPEAGVPPVRNGEFGQLDGWIVEYDTAQGHVYRALAGDGQHPATRGEAVGADGMLCIDATDTRVWVSQPLEPLHADTWYRVSCWVQAPAGANVVLALQSMTDWIDFARTDCTATGEGQLLTAVGRVQSASALVKARVKMEALGGEAFFTRVRLERSRAWDWPATS